MFSFSLKQNIFLNKTSFRQFNKHGFLRSEENIIIWKIQHEGVLVFVCLVNFYI